ncbi:MAG: hypothetical protein JSV90_00265 [Methanobacteriota archaeon]|nr:MAG: hypothetical protein JSV90_00265 [Euryarchaeota archaeon]
MTSTEITYFDRPGKQNTEAVLGAVHRRLVSLGLKHLVVASNSGDTAMKAIERFADLDVQVVTVTSHCGFSGEGMTDMSPEAERALAEAGSQVVRASHALSGVERSFTRKLGGCSRAEAVSDVLRALFGQGMKVCVEITLMAADNGAIPCSNQEVAVIAGTGEGADTACILRPAHANDFFKMEVREIIATPRAKRGDE